MVDDVCQPHPKALRVESRIHAQLPYDIRASKETIVAILSFQQVIHMAPVSPTTWEERGRALTDVRIDASGTFGNMTARAVDAVELDAHVEPVSVPVMMCREVSRDSVGMFSFHAGQ